MNKQQKEERKKLYFNEPYRVLFNEFVVDSFRYRTTDYNYYLLSHFHSDHYGGISKKWKCGYIIGTEITLSLLKKTFFVDASLLKIINLNSPMLISGKDNEKYVLVALEASHAPGSCCFLIKRLRDNKTYLHTGDFRFGVELERNEGWNKYVFGKEIDSLFLDTTFCDTKMCFQDKNEICKEAFKIFKENDDGKTLFIVCGYSIGKEYFVETLAKKINCSIHVSEEKFEILRICDRDLSLYTLEESKLELRQFNFFTGNTLEEELSTLKGKYERMVIFIPTGWSEKRREKGTYYIREFLLPYSEHSSFNELIQCYKMIKPKNLIPTVIDKTTTAERLVKTIKEACEPKVGPLDKLFSRIKEKDKKSL